MSALRLLEDYEIIDYTDTLPLGPAGLLTGVLPNGMSYYINKTKKPKNRASIRLAVKIGSIVEEEEERGVAHIVEHLAFSATSESENHAVVQKLRSIGCEFGPCLNAYTGMEETVYEFLIPTDEPGFLPQVLNTVAEFAFKVRCSTEDLEKERGPILEEWRSMRQAGSRASQALWALMHQGSKYADRMPIGLESVIRNVSASTVKNFYSRWYHPAHMAVVVVGDFDDLNVVLEAVETALGFSGVDLPAKPAIPVVQWAPHNAPRCQVFVDRETQSPLISLMFKKGHNTVSTPEGLPVANHPSKPSHNKEDLLHAILNRRLNNLCRQGNCPVYAAQSSTEPVVTNCSAHNVIIVPLPGAELAAFEAVMVELARLRLHGAAERELELAKGNYLAEYEQLYQERDQTFADDLAGEYVRHFTQQELVIGAEAEARLAKTLMKRVSLADTLEVSQEMRSTCNCIVKVIERVDAQEAAGCIAELVEDLPPERLLEQEPQPGDVVCIQELKELGAKELKLSNGMCVVFRHSDLQEDQILLSGFAPGALTEQPLSERANAGVAITLAEEMGVYGFKPNVMDDIITGKRVSVRTSIAAFWRTVGGEISPLDIDIAMQMIYKLFTSEVVAVKEDLQTTLQIVREQVAAQQRDPLRKFKERVRKLNYGPCAQLQPLTLRDVACVDVHAACNYFNRCFRDPAEFTLCFVGNIKEEEAFVDMAKRYLASIPRAVDSSPMDMEDINELELQFPSQPVKATVPVNMVEPTSNVQITFPVQLPVEGRQEEAHWLSAICKLLEHRLTEKLRFQAGSIYSVQVSSFFALEAPSRKGPLRGDVAVQFTCSPGTGNELGAMVLQEVAALQDSGPSVDEMMTGSYQSRKFKELKGADAVFKADREARERMRATADTAAFRQALRRLLPWPCSRRYTIVTTVQATVLHSLVAVASQCAPWLVGALMLGAFWVWHGRRAVK